jgi:hypothetical protein
MYLLSRIVSPYTAANRLLGVFSMQAHAARARRTYLARIRRHDPWARQAYWDPSPKDVKVVVGIPEIGLAQDSRRVFVVSRYEQCFGQTSREFTAICGAEAEARRIVAEVEAVCGNGWPVYAIINDVEVGVLLPDATTT